MHAMTTEHDGMETAMTRFCGSCSIRRGCAVEGAARVYWPEHQHFPAEWEQTEAGWRCAAYQAPRITGGGRIDDPSQAEMFSV